jgi:hypothetical protein
MSKHQPPSTPAPDPWQQFESWAREARLEPAPVVNVTGSVMRALPSEFSAPLFDKTLLVVCGVAVMVASLMMLLSIEHFWLLDDPLSDMFEPMRLVLR